MLSALAVCALKKSLGPNLKGKLKIRREAKKRKNAPNSGVRFFFSFSGPYFAMTFWVDVLDIFYFFCSGRGKGESEASGGGGFDFYWRSQEGGSPRGGGGEGPGGCLRRIGEFGGGGAKYFLGGRNVHQVVGGGGGVAIHEKLEFPKPGFHGYKNIGSLLPRGSC